ncbi:MULTISPECIES: manganese efflux pump MntP family protein [Dehalococcoides]|uniref:Putative manganese efflux pump MntP n=1 Tax=Dehalococcoides mccartyi TaxID=61435 RepID=A0AB38Z8B0_9CHLR|nr:manganese efflux pump MntP family protein [Dehalococcoides mccartyi]OBW61676.1 MAG: manganese efflux pump MntP [Dehalococcoides mccartyi]WRO06814.1 manganese efflux pump MntP family protein [Dehalococcoides mccartyi]
MSLLSVVFVALALSADCFAVSIGIACTHTDVKPRIMWRVAGTFGLFQAGMAVIGYYAGLSIADVISSFDHWVAFGLLAVIGGRMVYESVQGEDDQKLVRLDLTRGLGLLGVAIATSIDALAVGLTFSLSETNIGLAALLVGAVSLAVSYLGFKLGNRISHLASRWVGIAGGLILCLIGLKILAEHTLGWDILL